MTVLGHFWPIFGLEMILKPRRAYFLYKSNYQKKFQLKIPILRKIDCSAFYANASAGINFIWDLSVMLPGAKNRFRIFGGILLQIFFYFRLAVLHEIHLDANNPYKYVVSLPIEPHSWVQPHPLNYNAWYQISSQQEK